MPMTTLTIIQTSLVFLLYILVTCVLPFPIFNKRMKGFSLSVRVMFCYLFGNFYIVNLVFLLQLLHISNAFTLVMGTVVPWFVAMSKLEHWPVLYKLQECFHTIKKVVEKELGVKTLLLRVLRFLFHKLVSFLGRCIRVILKHPLECVVFLALGVLAWYMYGQNLLEHFGYCASDIPVHNYWINYMSRDQLFVAGVYPFGFHCIVYYLHAVFGLETYVMLRVICFIQTLIVHWALLFFLRSCLKSRYIAYLGVAVYMGSNLFQANTYSRFNSSLPQEFGMIFILPAIYFGFAFFQHRCKELDVIKKKEKEGAYILQKEQAASGEGSEVLNSQEEDGEASLEELTEKQKKRQIKRLKSKEYKQSRWCLAGFAMSFSLTLAVHFYGTMIAGIFCVAMAIGYFFRFLRKGYFGAVVATCFASVVSAVLPMVIAFALGTPLQGSLGWGMNILKGEDTETETVAETEAPSATQLPVSAEGVVTDTADDEQPADIDLQPQQSLKERLVEKAKSIPDIFTNAVNEYVSNHNDIYFLISIFGSMALLLVLSLLFFIGRKTDYAAAMLSVDFFILFMCVLASAGALGLPRLMDGNRSGIYFSYCVPILWCFAIDGVLTLLLGWIHKGILLKGVSFVVLVVVCGFLYQHGYVKNPYNANAMQTNDAITCLTNIIHEHDDWTWTICSANDELRMGEDYGFHYETIDFLREIENINTYADVTIPTKYTYFFVEKVPLDYAVRYENSGQSISKEGAKRELPRASGIAPYQGENRWIVMSRMYYWAEAFRKMYPNEMTVYYESDVFICYRLEQNIDRLFELGIDYGYNNFMAYLE